METDLTGLKQDKEAVLGGFEAVGLDVDLLLQNLVNPTMQAVSDERVPELEGHGHIVEQLWRVAMTMRPDPLLPFWVGTAVPFGCYEIIDYMCTSSPTLGTGLQQLSRYLRLVAPDMTLTVGTDMLSVRGEHAGEEARLIYGLYTTGIVMARFRRATGVRFVPTVAELAAPAGLDTSEVSAWLGAPCTFGHKESRLLFESGTFELPMQAPEPRLAALLKRYADDILTQRSLERAPLNNLREAIRKAMHVGEITLDQVAQRLGMGERTLQRRLAESGVSYTHVLDQERRDWSTSLLRDQDLSISEVAFLLGYSEQSAFARAFKRWTGKAPTTFRRQAMV